MQWIEDTGDVFFRSNKLCTMTKVRYQVSRWYYEQTEAGKKALAEEREGTPGNAPDMTPRGEHGNGLD